MAVGIQVEGGLFGRLCPRTHHDDDAVGIGRADVIEQLVLPSRQGGKLVHRLLHHHGASGVKLVDALPCLEVDIGVLCCTPNKGVIGREATGAMGANQVVVHHGPHHVVGDGFDFVDFVGGAEAIEKVQEGDAGAEGRGRANQGEIHRLLHGVGRQQGKPCLPGGHHVAVVAKNG